MQVAKKLISSTFLLEDHMAGAGPVLLGGGGGLGATGVTLIRSQVGTPPSCPVTPWLAGRPGSIPDRYKGSRCTTKPWREGARSLRA